MAKNQKGFSLIEGLLVLLALGGLVTAVILLTMIHHRNSINAELKTIAAARAKSEASDDEWSDNTSQALVKNGIDITEAASSKYDACIIGHEDQGWFAHNWYQSCFLRYVTGFYTPQDEQTIRDKLSHPLVDMGQPTRTAGCDILNAPATLEPFLTFRPAPTPIDRPPGYCGVPELAGTAKYLHSIDGTQPVTKVYKTFNAADLDNSKNQIWIVKEDEYYHKDIGCSGFLCDTPRKIPLIAP